MHSQLLRDGAGQGPALISLRDLVKSYSTPAGSFIALNQVSLDIHAGEFVSIVGKSGSGKTTLINMITGIDVPSQGEVTIGGTAVHLLSEGKKAVWRGRNIGVVFQFFQLLPTLSILENVMLPMSLSNLVHASEHEARALEILRRVNLASKADKLPHLLSGGEQQQAAIARALANDPPIIATDEPTGNLDSKSATAIMRLFGELVDQGKTILMVTHDADLAKRAGRIIRMVDGQIIPN